MAINMQKYDVDLTKLEEYKNEEIAGENQRPIDSHPREKKEVLNDEDLIKGVVNHNGASL